MKKEFKFTVTEPLYNNEYSKYFKYKKSWEGKIKIESITENCIVATVSAECTRFDIVLTKYYTDKDGNNSYCFTMPNWRFGGILARHYGYSMYNDDQLRHGIDNPIDRLSAVYAIGKLIEIFEHKKTGTIDEVDELFKSVGKTLDVRNERYSWNEGYGIIICESREDADEIANVFDDMYDCGTCEVGTFNDDKYFVRNF